MNAEEIYEVESSLVRRIEQRLNRTKVDPHSISVIQRDGEMLLFVKTVENPDGEEVKNFDFSIFSEIKVPSSMLNVVCNGKILPSSFLDDKDHEVMLTQSGHIYVYNIKGKIATPVYSTYYDIENNENLRQLSAYLSTRKSAVLDEKKLSPVEAFVFQIRCFYNNNKNIKNKEYADNTLDNLCNIVCQTLGISSEEFYNRISTEDSFTEEEAKIVYDCAQSLINEGKHMGTGTDGSYSTSSWISHSINVSKTMRVLARMIGLDEDEMEVMGLFHDFGRMFDHSFDHVEKGYEYLMKNGYRKYARGILVHSFMYLFRWGNFENMKHEDMNKQDIYSRLLGLLFYTKEDMLMNLADLMGTDILSSGEFHEKQKNEFAMLKTATDNFNSVMASSEEQKMVSDMLIDEDAIDSLIQKLRGIFSPKLRGEDVAGRKSKRDDTFSKRLNSGLCDNLFKILVYNVLNFDTIEGGVININDEKDIEKVISSIEDISFDVLSVTFFAKFCTVYQEMYFPTKDQQRVLGNL